MKIISTYIGEKQYLGRQARVLHHPDDHYIVEFWENNEWNGSVKIENHTLEYAEDTAENWVIGVIKTVKKPLDEINTVTLDYTDDPNE